jgi:hypothetical protein
MSEYDVKVDGHKKECIHETKEFFKKVVGS